MRKFSLGLALGLLFGTAGTAMAARLIGTDGYLLSWTVEVDGDEVCTDPYVIMGSNQIVCDN